MTRFRSAADAANEADVAGRLAAAWHCDVLAFPPLTPLDFYAARGDAMVALLELKCRTHDVATYGTVWLSVRKWLALTLAEAHMAVPGVFVVRWLDALGWVHVHDIDARRVTIVRDSRMRNGDATAVEPAVEVPVSAFTMLP